MEKSSAKKKSFLTQIVILYAIIALVTILVSGAVTYANQTSTYHEECVNNLHKMTEYILSLIDNSGDEFTFLKQYFTEHPDRVQIPPDYKEDVKSSEKAFYEYCNEHYDGRTPESGLGYDEMDDEAQRLYVNYRFEYWYTVFNDAVDKFGLTYMYFGFPVEGEDHVINFMFEPPVETVTTDEGKEILLIGEKIYEDPAIHENMWQAWEEGKSDYVDIMDNEYGYVYTYCQPLVINGEKIGLLCSDISVDKITSAITSSVIRQVLFTSIVFILASVMLLLSIDKGILRRIIRLEKLVEKYSEEKDPSIAKEISASNTYNDEIGSLYDRFSDMITDLDEYMKDLQQVTAEKERIGAELNVATKIQADMLPSIFPAFPDIKEFDIYATMEPAKEVGGDFYDFYMVDDKHLAVVIADVSGKGVPAALFMVIAKTLIKNHMLMGESPAEALVNVNNQLCEGNEAGLFVTVWLALIDLETGHVIEANAGHENPAISGEAEPYVMRKTRHSPAVAALEGMKFRENEFDIKPGDKLFVYTDGVTEATNINFEMFGEERLEKVLNKYQDADCKDLLPAVRKEIDEFVGEAPQFDDITMLVLEYFGTDGDSQRN